MIDKKLLSSIVNTIEYLKTKGFTVEQAIEIIKLVISNK